MSDDNPEGSTIGDKYVVQKFIAGGSFGKLHWGRNLRTDEKVAIKLEPRDHPMAQLPLEYRFYKILGKEHPGIPKIMHFGPCGEWHALVMQLLGPTLEKLLETCGERFSLKTTTMIALQLMDIFEYFHSKRLMYRDVKPENFLLGVTGTVSYNKIYIIDLGLCKEYKDENGVHIPFVTGKGPTGTARYMSINNHLGREQSRRDDLEAIGYMLVYFFKGQLPWQGVAAENIKEKVKKIGDIKKHTNTDELCRGMPEQFANYIKSVKGLEFEEEPKYKKYIQHFHNVLAKNRLKNDDDYDWDINHRKK